jgi:hypothetical protein
MVIHIRFAWKLVQFKNEPWALSRDFPCGGEVGILAP